MHRPHVQSGGRYPVLRALAIIYMLSAVLTVLVGIYAIGWALARFSNGMDRLVLVSAACAATFIAVVTMLAIAEVLKLFIDIEHNTRMAGVRTIGPIAASTATASAVAATAGAGNGGAVGGRLAELELVDEETAEAALIRGH